MIIMPYNKAWSIMFLVCLQQRQLFFPPTKTIITVILFGVRRKPIDYYFKKLMTAQL